MQKVNRKAAITTCISVWFVSFFLAALPGAIAILDKKNDIKEALEIYNYDKRVSKFEIDFMPKQAGKNAR